MGATNFHYTNASTLYVVYDRYYDEEYEKEIYKDWSEMKCDIQCMGEEYDWIPYIRSFRFGSDSDTAVLTKEYWFEYSNSGYRYKVDAYITMNAGYYEHCNLDYRLTLDGMDGDDSPEDIVGMMVEDFESPNNCIMLSFGSSDNKYWNDGLRKMQSRNFRKAAEAFLDSIVEECESMCARMCDDRWKAICHASNGETLYEKVG